MLRTYSARTSRRTTAAAAVAATLLDVVVVALPAKGADPCIATKATIEIDRSLAKGWYLRGTGTMECGRRSGRLAVSFIKFERPCCGVPSVVESEIARRDHVGGGTTLEIIYNLRGGDYCWATFAEVHSEGIETEYMSDIVCEE